MRSDDNQALAQLLGLEPVPDVPGDVPELDMRVGRCVRAARQEAGMSIAQLARAAQMGVGRLSRMEHGVSRVAVRDLLALAEALDVPMAWLLGRTEAFVPGTHEDRTPKGPVSGVHQTLEASS